MSPHRVRRLSFVALIAALAPGMGCNAPSQPLPSILTTTFASSLGINVSAMTLLVDPNNGDSLYYQDTVVGTGELVKPTTVIKVEYTAYIPNGTEFDASSAHEGVNTTFVAGGSGTVEGTFELQGWIDGIPGMHEGGTRVLILSPGLGYGDATFGIVPPNSITVYKITVTQAG